MIALLNFIAYVVGLYMYVVIIAVIMSWLIQFGVLNTQNQFVYAIHTMFYRLTEPALRPIRRRMPDLGGLDISPIVLILALMFLQRVVIYDWLPRLFLDM